MENQKLSVGEEVMQWAEKYWLIDKILKGEIGKGEGEAMDYSCFRGAIIRGINELVKERLVPAERPTVESINEIGNRPPISDLQRNK